MDRIININKPKGMSSHDVVYKVRKILGIKKVGHTGTLDPDASGVLPICVGRATKVASFLVEKEKIYLCTMRLGVVTDTYDMSGKILHEKSLDNISEADIKKALQSQIGEIMQMPPIYSAIRINGKRLYELARENRIDEVEIKPRKVSIRSIDILNIDIPNSTVVFRVECGKGTYIRSICHDVGEILGVGAAMKDLIREKSGIFTIERAIDLEELSMLRDEDKLFSKTYSIEEVLSEYPKIVLKENAVKYYSNGGIIEDRRFEYSDYKEADKFARVYSKKDFIGVGILKRGEHTTVKSYKIFK